MSHLAEVIDQIKREERHDPVTSPLHYAAGGIECINAIEVAIAEIDGIEAHLTACCIRYLWRWNKKNGLEDLRKCQEYLRRLIQKVEDA